MEATKKISALKRFQTIADSVCSPYLSDVRCSFNSFEDYTNISRDTTIEYSSPESSPVKRTLLSLNTATPVKNEESTNYLSLERLSFHSPQLDQYDCFVRRRRTRPSIKQPTPLLPSHQTRRLEEVCSDSPSKRQKFDELNQLEEVLDHSDKSSLSTIKGRHSDLKYITPQTLETVLIEGSDKKIMIIDCRYPYEYDGGHIIEAENLYTKELIQNRFIDEVSNDLSKDTILIFHCEFSSERGPKMYRFLREQDRGVHKDCYPCLYYPEMYILHGGYKAFYEETTKQLCQPQQYLPMIHESYTKQLKLYRNETKKWNRSKSNKQFTRHHLDNVRTQLDI